MMKTFLLWLLALIYLLLGALWLNPGFFLGLTMSNQNALILIFIAILLLFFLLKLNSLRTWVKFFNKIKGERASILFLSICTMLIVITCIPMFRYVEGLLDSDMAAAGLFALRFLRDGLVPPAYIGLGHHIGNFDAFLVIMLLSIFPAHPIVYALPPFLCYILFFWIFLYFVRDVFDRGTAVITAFLLIYPSYEVRFHWFFSTSNTILWLLLSTICFLITKKIVESDRNDFFSWGVLGFLCGFAFWQRQPAFATIVTCLLYLSLRKWNIEYFKKLGLFFVTFLIGFSPAVIYNSMHEWGTFSFVFNKLSDKASVWSLSSLIRQIDLFIGSFLNALFSFDRIRMFLDLDGPLIKYFYMLLLLIFVLMFIYNKRYEISNSFQLLPVKNLGPDIFLVFSFIVILQNFFNPAYGMFAPFLNVRFYLPAVVFIYPIVASNCLQVLRKSKILGCSLILFLLIPHFFDYQEEIKRPIREHADVQEFKEFVKEKDISIIHTGYQSNDRLNLFTSIEYFFDSEIGPLPSIRPQILAPQNPPKNSSEIIVSQWEARKYVKELFQISRFEYETLNLNYIDIYYDYPGEFVDIFFDRKPIFLIGKDIFDFDKPLAFTIDVNEGDTLALDALLILRRWFSDYELQIKLIDPDGNEHSFLERPILIQYTGETIIKVNEYPDAIELQFDSSSPYYEGVGTYKIVPFLLKPETREVINYPISFSINVVG